MKNLFLGNLKIRHFHDLSVETKARFLELFERDKDMKSVKNEEGN